MPKRGSKARSSRRGGASGRLAGLKEALTPGDTTLTIVRVAGWVVLAGGIFAGVTVGLPELEARSIERDLASTRPLKVEFKDPPRWFEIDDALRSELEGTVVSAVGSDRRSTRIQSGLADAHRALEDTHWFESLDRLQWIDADTIRVDGRWVTLAGVVDAELEGEPKDVLVDERGHRLAYAFEPNTARHLPRIEGAARTHAPPVGEAWGDDVLAGINLHRLIADEPWIDQVASVDVSGHGDPSRGLVVRTNRCSIIWGLAPNEADPAEVPSASKLAYLAAFNQEYGRFDEYCMDGEFDVRHDMLLMQSADSVVLGTDP